MARAVERVIAKPAPGGELRTAADAIERNAAQRATVLRERLDAAASIPLNP